jgi:hypothetical protein
VQARCAVAGKGWVRSRPLPMNSPGHSHRINDSDCHASNGDRVPCECTTGAGSNPADIVALGWPGEVFAPGEWGRIVNGGAWLTVDGTKIDLIYRDLDQVLRWIAAAEDGRFEIEREVGYVAGIATYVLAGELALGRVLAGDLPCPEYPPKLRQTAPVAWFRLAAGALHFADVHAGRQDRVACLANLCQAVLAAAQGRLAAAGEWVLNEKRLVQRAGLGALQDRLGEPGLEVAALVSDIRAALALQDAVWAE